ncbi:MAG TPA: serine/threonine-protein kinase [Anaeromyxobacteraceae bacterium]
MPPRGIGPYEILSLIGRGGIGTVYRARHRETGRLVAVKLLGPPPACDASAARRLAREFEALARLDHPNVVRVHEAGVAEGYSFLSMELVEGLDLRAYLSPLLDEGAAPAPAESPPPGAELFGLEALAREPDTESFFTVSRGAPGPDAIRELAELLDEPETDPGAPAARRELPEGPGFAEARAPSRQFLEALNRSARMGRLVHALRQVCDGLAYVHRSGLVHRDLKPSNVMVDDRRRVRIMDFGLVRLADAAAGPEAVVGTYRYMAPEQARGGPVDSRADLFSLGVILWELLAGRPPPGPRGRPAPAPPPIASVNAGADARLAAVAGRLLERDPAHRFQRAEDVLEALG